MASWSITLVASGWLLAVRERLIVLDALRPADLWSSWRAILHVGLPAAGASMLIPAATGVLTRLAASFGTGAVAAFGVAGRLQAVALIGINAMATALTPFVGQNYGAGSLDRIRAGLRYASRFTFAWGTGVAVVLIVAAQPLARLFNDAPDVVGYTVDYLRVVPITYGLLGMVLIANTTFAAIGRPVQASLVVLVRLFVLAVPLAWLGARLFAVRGMFGGIAISNLLACAFAVLALRRELGRATMLRASPSTA